MPNGGRGEATGNVYFFTGIIREGQIRKRGQNLFVAILFNSRGIDRSVEGGREGGRERYRLLFIFARFKQAGFDLEIGRVKIDTSREGGRGSVGSIVKKEGMGFQE